MLKASIILVFLKMIQTSNSVAPKPITIAIDLPWLVKLKIIKTNNKMRMKVSKWKISHIIKIQIRGKILIISMINKCNSKIKMSKTTMSITCKLTNLRISNRKRAPPPVVKTKLILLPSHKTNQKLTTISNSNSNLNQNLKLSSNNSKLLLLSRMVETNNHQN